MSTPSSMVVESGKVVSLAYRLTNDGGDLLDRADPSEPFEYIHGTDQIVPGLENALTGLKAGDKKKVVVEPSEGYGEKRDELVMKVPRTKFPGGGADLEEGMQFETSTPQGESMVFSVISVSKNEVEIDGNHPMAGQRLNFEVEVLGVRDATREELAHGHVHGPGGHGHGHGHSHGDDDGEGGGVVH